MPRGKPKRGQFLFKVWRPEGGSFQCNSHRDLSEDEFRESALKYLDMMRDYVLKRGLHREAEARPSRAEE